MHDSTNRMTVLATSITTDVILMMPDALHAFLTVWLFFVGGCVGSFLNVVVFRLPAGISLSRGGSRCPICRHPIRWYDNIPLISWILLRGKCRDCGTHISKRYPLVELLVAVMFLVLAYGEGFNNGDNLPTLHAAFQFPQLPGFEVWSIYVYHLVLLVTLVGAALIQHDQRRVPWSMYLFASVVGLCGPLAFPHLHPLWNTVGPIAQPHVAGMLSVFLGSAVGATLGLLAGPQHDPLGVRLSNQPPCVEPRRLNPAGEYPRLLAAYPAALCGMFLGWQAACVVVPLTSCALLIQAIVRRCLPRLAALPWQAYLAVFAIIYILNWKALATQFPALGVHGGLEVVGYAALLITVVTLLSGWIARPARPVSRAVTQARNDIVPEVTCLTSSDSTGQHHPECSSLAQHHDPCQAGEVMQRQDVDENLKAILDSPSYLPVEQDAKFLARPALRPVRVQLELLKPEIELAKQNVTSTIVVFGGTQIVPRGEANRRLEKAKQSLAEVPDDPERERAVRRAERVLAKVPYYDAAREFAQLVSSECQHQEAADYVIITGGGPGIMEAANRGAHDVDAKSIGLNITLPQEQTPNPYITPELCFQFHYFALRKMHFLLRAKALVVFPGGFGTLDELFDALTLRQTHRMQEIPIILFGKNYWNQVINFQFLADEGVIADKDLQLLSYAETAADAWQIIREHHATTLPNDL